MQQRLSFAAVLSKYKMHVLLFGLTFIFGITLFKQSTIPCANTGSCRESQQLKIENDQPGIFGGKVVKVPRIDLKYLATKPNVLGEKVPAKEKRIIVNLKLQKLTAYEGSEMFLEADVSTGKWNPTPVGEFHIWIKLRATRMSGGQGADRYDLPNVPYTMFFSNASVPPEMGYGLHGAYWHNNFGHRMSHGCINMRETDVAKLYEWATPTTTGWTTYASSNNPGTKLIIVSGD